MRLAGQLNSWMGCLDPTLATALRPRRISTDCGTKGTKLLATGSPQFQHKPAAAVQVAFHIPHIAFPIDSMCAKYQSIQ
jgi:hypothetical protein